MKKGFFLLFTMAFSGIHAQGINTSLKEYSDKNVVLEGFLATGDVTEKKPLVIVVHEWKGINEYTKMRCRQLAELGYVAFAADVYGKGVRPSTPSEAGKEAGKYKSDRTLMRERMNAALRYAVTLPGVDTNKIAVIGYCFGGTAALELGRSGADIDGIVSIHGGLDNPAPQDAANIRAKVLICHGAIDPNVPEKEVLAFQKEMNDAKIDYHFISYSNAVHAFTNPEAGNDISKGVAYNEVADKRSWKHMVIFLEEVFGEK